MNKEKIINSILLAVESGSNEITLEFNKNVEFFYQQLKNLFNVEQNSNYVIITW